MYHMMALHLAYFLFLLRCYINCFTNIYFPILFLWLPFLNPQKLLDAPTREEIQRKRKDSEEEEEKQDKQRFAFKSYVSMSD